MSLATAAVIGRPGDLRCTLGRRGLTLRLSRMMRRGVVLVGGGALLAGCGGDDGEEGTSTTRTPSVARFLGELPVGYRDAPAPRPEVEKAFREKVTRDFDATEVEVRNVYLGAQFVAGELAVRARRPLSAAAPARKGVPGRLRPQRVTIAGQEAYPGF